MLLMFLIPLPMLLQQITEKQYLCQKTGLFFKVLIFSKLPSIGMKGRWEKVWNMGNILWNYSTWPMGEWGIYCKVVPYWNSRGNSLTVQ